MVLPPTDCVCKSFIPMGSEALQQMESQKPRQGSCEEEGTPDSWELADLEESMRKLLVPSVIGLNAESQECSATEKPMVAAASSSESGVIQSEGVDQVDSFLREALQNFRDRLTILRLEQEVEKFMRNPRQQQLEFQPMPSSYLRLAAHRVAQHYGLQSMVVDCNIPDGTRIIAQKTSESRFPAVRLSDIPVNLPQEEKALTTPAVRVAIKQRPQKGSRANGDCNGAGGLAARFNPSKSVEERKEEYSKARARIFSSGDLVDKAMEEEYEVSENSQNEESFSSGTVKLEENFFPGESHEMIVRGGFSDGAGKTYNGKVEREAAIRMKVNTNRVAIFRDREKDRKDPDYDRSYDRHLQRFDPGFGVNLGPLSMQAMYAPVSNYNAEFPQLGHPGPMRPQFHVEPPPPCPSLQHMRGRWMGGSNSIGFGAPDAVMGPFNTGHLGPHSGSAMYLHTPQFACPGSTMTYIHPQEHFQQSVSQPHLQPEANLSQARRR